MIALVLQKAYSSNNMQADFGVGRKLRPTGREIVASGQAREVEILNCPVCPQQ